MPFCGVKLWVYLGRFGQGICKISFLYLLDISLRLSKGLTKCQGTTVYLVVLSEFYESEPSPFNMNTFTPFNGVPFTVAFSRLVILLG